MFRREPENGRKHGLVHMGVRGLSGVVGLASESIKTHKGRGDGAEADSTPETPPPAYQSEAGDEIEVDDELEFDWKLDEAQYTITDESLEHNPDEAPPAIPAQPQQSTRALSLDSFLAKYPARDARPGTLPLPVILPQRRPKARSRGFIRAYAPVLENCGIDQTMWISLIETLHKASMADPWLNAINLAGTATFLMPSALGALVSIAIQQATNAVIELQGRYRTSNAIDALNESFFRPRGLCCLVMMWNPASTRVVEQVNISETISSRANSGGTSIPQKFRSAHGWTYGDVGFPEVAPLVFPGLDKLAAQRGSAAHQQQSKIIQRMAYVRDYWDRRATAEYAMKNPDSVLSSVPPPEFTSRYADPNHPASSGSLISFVSGGKLIPGPRSRGPVSGLVSVAAQAARGEKQGASWERYNEARAHARNSSKPAAVVMNTPVVATAKRLIAQDVLYLMVVNLPTEEEMEQARKVMAQH